MRQINPRKMRQIHRSSQGFSYAHLTCPSTSKSLIQAPLTLFRPYTEQKSDPADQLLGSPFEKIRAVYYRESRRLPFYFFIILHHLRKMWGIPGQCTSAGLIPGFEKPSVSPGWGRSLVKCWKAKTLPEIFVLWVGRATGPLRWFNRERQKWR